MFIISLVLKTGRANIIDDAIFSVSTKVYVGTQSAVGV